jgi:hypothetical protein
MQIKCTCDHFAHTTGRGAGIGINVIIHQQRILHNEALIRNAHFVGIELTSFGTLLLFVETLQFVRRNKQLSAIMKEEYNVFSIDVFLSGMVLLLGLALIYFMIATG